MLGRRWKWFLPFSASSYKCPPTHDVTRACTMIASATGFFTPAFLAILLLSSGGLLTSCAQRGGKDAAKIEDSMDADVLLPKGSLPRTQYIKFLEKTNHDIVKFVYVYPLKELGRISDPACLNDRTKLKCKSLSPGQVVWVSDIASAPLITGGGCVFIEGAYRISSKSTIFVRCNGPI